MESLSLLNIVTHFHCEGSEKSIWQITKSGNFRENGGRDRNQTIFCCAIYFDITNAQEFSHIKYFVYRHVHM